MALQLIVRQLVTDMLDQKLEPLLYGHADLQGALQRRMQPPQAMDGDASMPPGQPQPPQPINGVDTSAQSAAGNASMALPQ
jgi:hypothetical protein